MTTKSIVESAWVEDMGQFLYHLDPDTRKITRKLEKIKAKIIKCPIVFNKICLNDIYIYMSVCACVCVCERERERETERERERESWRRN